MFYTMQQLNEYLDLFNVEDYKIITENKGKKGKFEYYNIISTFDTEATSCYKKLDTGEILQAKVVSKIKEEQGLNFDTKNYKQLAFTYIWMFSLDEKIIIGRTWDEYKLFINALCKKFNLSSNKRIITYVHNLSYDFQFYRTEFEWENVFATEKRKLIYATGSNGIEYKCSYMLSNLTLEQVGKNLVKYKAEKKVGDLDYDLIRTWKTPLTDKEIEYCCYDVIVLNNYIKECMENEAHDLITDLVLTNTGRVRKYCREYCLSEENRFEYNLIMKEMSLTVDIYEHLKQCFQGGFTHANAINSMTTIKDVFSVDFTSSYPAVLLMRKYPMGSWCKLKPKTMDAFNSLIKSRACLFVAHFKNIKLKDMFSDSIISSNKCLKLKKPIVNNGRVTSAEYLQIVVNEIDYLAITKFYDFEDFQWGWFASCRKDYLPRPLLECILHFYKNKTTLKDVIGEEANYQLLKGMLNSSFGMMVTDIIREVIEYDDKCGWLSSKDDKEKAIDKYNKSKSRFLSYEWGVWCTSYARYNLFSGIFELKSDFIYADTDSLKFTNYESHKNYFEWYNNTYIPNLIKKVCLARNLNEEDFTPKTIKGKTKLIGVWDLESKYDAFRTLGAKRYLVKYNESDEHYKKDLDGYSITVSGINKKVALPYLYEKAKKEHVEMSETFNEELYVDGEHSGKLLHSYIDNPIDEEITDYLGITARVIQKTAVHLEPTSYAIGDTIHEYIDYVRGIKTKVKKGC